MKVLALILGISFAADAWALQCTPKPSCESLGFTDTDCSGEFVACPFDQNKKICLTCASQEPLCQGYTLTSCPSNGICESCPNDSSRKKLTSCQNDYYHYGNKCLNTTCKSSAFPNRQDLVLKAIEESGIFEEYANAFRSGWLATYQGKILDKFTEDEIQEYVKELAINIQFSLQSTYCYNSLQDVYAEDYYVSKYNDEAVGGSVTRCCSPRNSAGKGSICADIRDFVEEECHRRGDNIKPYGVSGDVCQGFGHADWQDVEVPDYSGQISNYQTMCEQALQKAGLRYN